MESAKAAVKDFMHKSGKHDTTVHETVAPAVTKETIAQEQREHVTTAVDKEVHQDHYHTSVQPIKDAETLPEQHHHRMIPVEERQFEHGNDADVKARLGQEAAQFKDETRHVEGAHMTNAAPVIAGEHVHHHVHETIQPVVEKQTIEPHVVHTTVPVHEVHHNEAQHHSTTALPAVTMDEFKNKGGALTGREERHDGFAGEPRSIGKTTHGTGSSGDANTMMRPTGDTLGSDRNALGDHNTAGSDIKNLGSDHNNMGSANLGSDGHTGHTGAFGTTAPATDSTRKASLMDKLNPKKDANGDGKAGFMS